MSAQLLSGGVAAVNENSLPLGEIPGLGPGPSC
jgi:hypothetical protein